MADGVVVANLGTGGSSFEVDVDALGHVWPYAKLAWGLSGTQTEVADAAGNRLPVKLAEVGSVTVPISAASLPLPTGAAADATLTGGSLVAIVKGGAKGSTTAAVLTSNPVNANVQALHVDGSTVTQPVSGTVTANAGSGTFGVSGTVTSNIGTTGGLALDATVSGLQIAQASTTSGQKGMLVLGAVTTAAPTYTTAQSDPLSLTVAGALRVDGSGATQPVSGTVTANIGTTGSLALDSTLTGGSQKAIPVAGTSGGATPFKLISAATTNATSVKGSAGTLYGIQVISVIATVRFLKLYDKASAPTVGTDTPIKVIPIPANTAGAGVVISAPVGINFANGIAFAITANIGDSDNTAIAANDCVVNLDYK